MKAIFIRESRHKKTELSKVGRESKTTVPQSHLVSPQVPHTAGKGGVPALGRGHIAGQAQNTTHTGLPSGEHPPSKCPITLNQGLFLQQKTVLKCN